MTAELEDQKEKGKEETVEEKVIESDDEKIKKIDDEESGEEKKNGTEELLTDKEKTTSDSEVVAVDGEETVAALQEEETVEASPRRAAPRFWERFFPKRMKKHKESTDQDPDAGTELLAKEGVKIEIVEDDAKKENNDNGADVTVVISDDTEANGEAVNGKAKESIKVVRPRFYESPRFRKFLFIFIVVVGSLLCIGIGLAFLGYSKSASRGPMLEPLVVTDCGPVRGIHSDGIYHFKGIPYALPPTGEHRWKPPRAASTLEDCWSGTFQALNNSAVCYQKPIPGMDVAMSEDCLTLDVLTPSLSPPNPRPVVVYIPGDNPLHGLKMSDLKFVPTKELADDNDVTFVVFRYRTGVLGFLSSEVLSSAVRPSTSGNYGIMDMIAALKWVQKNIRGFGGDPNKVTILAHGGTATAAVALMTTPKAKDLFKQMWLIAPAGRYQNESMEDVSNQNDAFFKKLDCYKMECLQNKTAEELIHATPNYWYTDWSQDLPNNEDEQTPVMIAPDGAIMFDSPFGMWDDGIINKVPVVIGSASQQAAYSNILPGLENWSWTDFSDYVSEKLGTIDTNLTVAAIEHYIHNSSTPIEQFYSMVSDIRTICPLQHLVDRLNKARSKPVYWYLVDYKPSQPVTLTNTTTKTPLSSHGLDMAAIFGILHHSIDPMTAADKIFQKNMQELFFSYVQNGIPVIKKENLMEIGFINRIGNQIRSLMTPYENCHIWNKDDYVYEKYAKVL